MCRRREINTGTGDNDTPDNASPEEPLKQERFKRQIIATTRRLKKKLGQIKAEHHMLNNGWTKVLAAEEGYGFERQTKSYPKHRLLAQFEEEALVPIPSKYNHADLPDRPPRGWDKTTNYAEYQPAPPRRRGNETMAPGYTYDLRQDLTNRAD